MLQKWLTDLQNRLLLDDLFHFAPELALCTGIILMLLLRLFKKFDRLHLGWIAAVATGIGLAISIGQFDTDAGLPDWRNVRDGTTGRKITEMFTGLLVYDGLTIYLRMFLLSFTLLIIWLSALTGIPDREDSGDFYSLLLGATLGMSLMASANHLLMVFIAIEMASLPSYALAGFLKGKRQSSEASLKYVVYGGGASGVMLYGISLIAGKFGTAYLPDLAAGYAAVLTTSGSGAGFSPDLVLVLGTMFILVGIAFKLAAVPFHFWCPDVFEGASAEVAAFLSVASKGAALALLGRFVLGLGSLANSHPDYDTWMRLARYLVPALAFFAVLTATFGNLAAYFQTNLKRLLAYSTIAHAGYMLMGLATFTERGLSAVLFYLVAYLFMNLGAFAVVAFLRNVTGSEDLSSYRGLVQRSPVMVITLGFFLFSLLGLPPLAGFAAKFQIFRVLYEAAGIYRDKSDMLSYTMYALLVIGGLNTVLSVFYYVKVLKVMILDRPLDESAGPTPAPLPVPLGSAAFASAIAMLVLGIGVLWGPIVEASDRGAGGFHAIIKRSSTLSPEQQGPQGGQLKGTTKGKN
jgi:NADH-quinone oxidoreductase subunit N